MSRARIKVYIWILECRVRAWITKMRMGARGMFSLNLIMQSSKWLSKRYLSELRVSLDFSVVVFFFIGHGMSLRTRIDEDRLISLALNNYFSLGSWDLNEAITSFDFFGQEERIFGPFPRRLFWACTTLWDSLAIWLTSMDLSRRHPVGWNWTTGPIILSNFHWDNGNLRWFVFIPFHQMLLSEALRICVRLSRTVKLPEESVDAK